MMDFKKDYPKLCEISMDINYRSRPEIIAVSGNLIKNNTERFSKEFVAARIAVLAQTNMQLDDVAAELDRRRISYTSSDAIKDIYDHFIFADINFYLRLINGGLEGQ